MAVPAEYQAVVDHLRQYGAATTTDTFGGVTYWNDDQLYAVLNEFIEHDYRYLRSVHPQGTVFVAKHPQSWWNREATIYVGNTIVTPAYDSVEQTYTFETAPSQTPTIVATYFNMTEALAKLWEQKAAQRYELIRVKAGSNQTFLEQEYEHCVSRARYYRSAIVRRFRR